MQKAGLTIREEFVLTSDFEFAGGFSSMQKLLSLPVRPQAVFTCNDAMAVGAYQAIYQKGLRVPYDISIIGYDDIDLASYMIPLFQPFTNPKTNWVNSLSANYCIVWKISMLMTMFWCLHLN